MIQTTSPPGEAPAVSSTAGTADVRRAGRGQGWGNMIMLGVLSSGYNSVEWIYNNVLPLTLRQFSDNHFFIAATIDLNRLSGIFVIPYIASKGDTVRSRFGRRRPFFLIGLPLTLLFLLLMGAMPLLITGSLRHTPLILAVVFCVGALLAVFQDVNFGAEGPLYGESFDRERLGRAVSCKTTIYAVLSISLFHFVMPWADENLFYPYLASAAVLVVALLVAIFWVREQPLPQAAAHAPPRRNSPLEYKRLLFSDSLYFRIAVIGAITLTLPVAYTIFHSLYCTEILGMSRGEFGRAMKYGPIMSLALSVPMGLVIDRLGHRFSMAAGFTSVTLASLAMMFLVRDYYDLIVLNILNAAGSLLYHMSLYKLVFSYAPANQRGRIFGLISFVRAFSAFIFTLLVGGLGSLFNTYRSGYSIALLLGIIGVVTVMSLPPPPASVEPS